jgi:hypothetical protein
VERFLKEFERYNSGPPRIVGDEDGNSHFAHNCFTPTSRSYVDFEWLLRRARPGIPMVGLYR